MRPQLNVQSKFPYRMHGGERASVGLFGCNIVQQIAQRGPMPWISFEGPVQLIGNAKTFGVHKKAAGQKMLASH